MNTASQGIEIAEYGHPKMDEGLPQVNLSYVISQDDGTPLMYELYHDSINDMEEMRPLISKVKDAGFNNIGFIIDRGYYIKKDLKMLDEEGYDYIAMVWKGSDSIKKEFEDKYRLLKIDNSLYLPNHDIYGITSKIKLFADDKKEKHLHIYCDSCRAESTRNEFNRLISEQERELNEKLESEKYYTAKQLGKYRKWFPTCIMMTLDI